MAEATAGLTAKGALLAMIETEKGTITCHLFEDRAPISVANFVGLARGLRPWKTPEGKWVKKPAYDGTTFHRIVKGFMIQGGDPSGTGKGMPGYSIPDEIWEGAYHDRAGQLCMANMGPDTNGAQFFITDGAAPHLDNRYTILGECSPTDVVRTIASGETMGDRAKTPVVMKKVTITRGVAPATNAPASASASASSAPPAPPPTMAPMPEGAP
jgi:peptidyl-prolyl cis-trans isomerase A (cyclophilin A)